MADLAITNVQSTATITGRSITLSETVPAFAVLQKGSDGRYGLASAADQDPSKAAGTHISLQGGDADELIIAVESTSGKLILEGVTLTVGEQYVVSATNGKIAPRSDLVSTNEITLLFIADTPTTGLPNYRATGIKVP